MSFSDADRLLATSCPAGFAHVTSGGVWIPYEHLVLLNDALLRVAAGELSRLIVQMPPRHGKSELISRYTPAWYLGRFPDRQVMLASYEAGFARTWGRKARDLLSEHGRDLFGVGVSDASAAADRWEIAGRDGVMVTAGAGGALTGKGAHLLVIDDPVKNAEEAQSETMREKLWDWWLSTARTRLMPASRRGPAGAAVLVMTRWHEDDLAGRMLATDNGDEWELLNLPALAESPDDALGRKEGEALCPELFDEATLEQIARGNSYWFSALYQQRPSPEEGDILKRAWWRYYEPHRIADPKGLLPHFTTIVQSWDMSFVDTDGSDYVVGQVWGRMGADKYLLRQTRARMEFTQAVQAVRDLTEWVETAFPDHAGHAKLVEDKANGPAVISALRRQIPGLVAVDPRGDKVARARAVSPDIESGNVYLPGTQNHDQTGPDKVSTPEWVQVFIDECAALPNGAHDDQVDACSQALLRLAGTGGLVRESDREKPKTLMGGLRSKAL